MKDKVEEGKLHSMQPAKAYGGGGGGNSLRPYSQQ